MIFDFVRFDDTSHEHKQSSSRRNDSVRTRRSQAASRFTPSFVCLLLLFCPVPQDLSIFFAREPAVRILIHHHHQRTMFFRENARDDDRNYERASERHCPRLSSLDSWVLCLSLTTVYAFTFLSIVHSSSFIRRRSSSFLETQSR